VSFDQKLQQENDELESDIQKYQEGIKDESVSVLSDCVTL
jgi:flagellar basal body-associated protein FliL